MLRAKSVLSVFQFSLKNQSPACPFPRSSLIIQKSPTIPVPNPSCVLCALLRPTSFFPPYSFPFSPARSSSAPLRLRVILQPVAPSAEISVNRFLIPPNRAACNATSRGEFQDGHSFPPGRHSTVWMLALGGRSCGGLSPWAVCRRPCRNAPPTAHLSLRRRPNSQPLNRQQLLPGNSRNSFPHNNFHQATETHKSNTHHGRCTDSVAQARIAPATCQHRLPDQFPKTGPDSELDRFRRVMYSRDMINLRNLLALLLRTLLERRP
jgi:hypothetical protein